MEKTRRAIVLLRDEIILHIQHDSSKAGLPLSLCRRKNESFLTRALIETSLRLLDITGNRVIR